MPPHPQVNLGRALFGHPTPPVAATVSAPTLPVAALNGEGTVSHDSGPSTMLSPGGTAHSKVGGGGGGGGVASSAPYEQP